MKKLIGYDYQPTSLGLDILARANLKGHSEGTIFKVCIDYIHELIDECKPHKAFVGLDGDWEYNNQLLYQDGVYKPFEIITESGSCKHVLLMTFGNPDQPKETFYVYKKYKTKKPSEESINASLASLNDDIFLGKMCEKLMDIIGGTYERYENKIN